MQCSDLTELISAYDDGELPETQRQYIEAHLSACADCRRLLAAYQATRRQIASLPIPAVPDIKAGVMARTNKPGFFSRRRLASLPLLVKVLVPAVLIAALALSLSLPFGGSGPSDFMSKVYAATERVTSYTFTSAFATADANGATYSSYLEIAYSEPSFYRIRLSKDGNQPSEIFMDSENIYALTPELTGVEAIISTGDSSTMDLRMDLGIGVTLTKEDTLELLGWLINLNRLPDEKIDGVNCFHYQGEIDMDKYVAKYIATVTKQHPEMADEPLLSRMAEQMRTIRQEIELWVGKDDYLMRQTHLTMTAPDLAIPVYSDYHYTYPAEPMPAPPLNDDGTTQPGWYLVTRGIFDRNISSRIQYLEDSRQIEARIDLTNVSEETCQNIRVFVAPGDISSSGQEIYSAAASAALAPGESQNFAIPWQAPPSDPFTSYSATRRVFVEYTTGDGLARIEVLSPSYY